MTLKQKIHNQYLTIINEKISLLQNVLADLKESGANETKSTAGDKHETALAMLQIEQASKRTQLNELVQQLAVLQKINPAFSSTIILNGSLVKTNNGYFYISTSLGKLNIDDVMVMAVSPQSPLAKKIMGLVVGQSIDINNHTYIIEEIS
jgi:transcription elongation GreA/GreB family factor